MRRHEIRIFEGTDIPQFIGRTVGFPMIGIYVLRLGNPPVHEFVRKGEIFRQVEVIMPERRVIHLIERTAMDI